VTAAKDKTDIGAIRGPEALFKASEKLEAEGIVIDYGDFWFRITRAGATNNRFKKLLDARMKPHRRAQMNDTLSNDVADKITRQVWAEVIVMAWGSKLGDGLMPFQGEALKFSVPNVVMLFEALPDLFIDLRDQSMQLGLFREDDAEAALGN